MMPVHTALVRWHHLLVSCGLSVMMPVHTAIVRWHHLLVSCVHDPVWFFWITAKWWHWTWPGKSNLIALHKCLEVMKNKPKTVFSSMNKNDSFAVWTGTLCAVFIQLLHVWFCVFPVLILSHNEINNSDITQLCLLHLLHPVFHTGWVFFWGG